MNKTTKKAIREHALAEYPRESCGLIVAVNDRERYFPCVNKARTPSEHFVISGQDYAFAEDMGQLVAVVHSHPDEPARPSEGDKVACEASELPWTIVSVMPGEDGPEVVEIRQIVPEGYEAPLEGRPFHHGVLDCWSLCRDWYAREWGLTLPNPDRPDNWWDDGHSDLYTDNYRDAGFVLAEGDMQRGDLILMQVRSKNGVPNHAAIYLGDGLILHHLYGRLSCKAVWGGYWAECHRMTLRHRSRVDPSLLDSELPC